MREKFRIILCLSAVLGLSACKKGVSEIEALKALSGFALNQQSGTVASKTAPTFTVSGTCTEQYHDVEMSLDGGKTWVSAAEVATHHGAVCGTAGTFNFNFAASREAKIHFRGISEFGYSSTEVFSLAVASAFYNSISSGGHSSPAVGAGFKLRGQVVGLANGATSSGGGFKVKGRLVTE